MSAVSNRSQTMVNFRMLWTPSRLQTSPWRFKTLLQVPMRPVVNRTYYIRTAYFLSPTGSSIGLVYFNWIRLHHSVFVAFTEKVMELFSGVTNLHRRFSIHCLQSPRKFSPEDPCGMISKGTSRPPGNTMRISGLVVSSSAMTRGTLSEKTTLYRLLHSRLMARFELQGFVTNKVVDIDTTVGIGAGSGALSFSPPLFSTTVSSSPSPHHNQGTKKTNIANSVKTKIFISTSAGQRC